MGECFVWWRDAQVQCDINTAGAGRGFGVVLFPH